MVAAKLVVRTERSRTPALAAAAGIFIDAMLLALLLVAGLERNWDGAGDGLVVVPRNRGGVGAVLFFGTTPPLRLMSEMVERNACSCMFGLA
jgi:hypothetical protein